MRLRNYWVSGKSLFSFREVKFSKTFPVTVDSSTSIIAECILFSNESQVRTKFHRSNDSPTTEKRAKIRRGTHPTSQKQLPTAIINSSDCIFHMLKAEGRNLGIGSFSEAAETLSYHLLLSCYRKPIRSCYRIMETRTTLLSYRA